MVTERQVEANRRNAARSTGPKTEAGKARSRANATTHGLSGESAVVEASRSPAFEARRAAWAAERRPVGDEANWSLDRAVAASLRIERCERAMDDLVESTRHHADLGWDEARDAEAAEVFARLGRDPVRSARRLRSTLAGAVLLLDAWTGLGQALLADGDWSEAEANRALDLLGAAPDLRKGRTAVDPPDGEIRAVFRRALVAEEVGRLEDLIAESLVPLDAGDRGREASGDLALISKPGRLLARYERDAWRRYRESLAGIEAPAPVEPQVWIPTPAPPPLPCPPAEPAPATFEEERRAIQAIAAPFRAMAEAQGFPVFEADDDDEDDSAWLDEIERRLDRRDETNPISGPELALA